ncbi:MAG: hypothetical protein KC733_00010 [Candidatus Omnitrophica bacterium]|nr:hypothetical protein [Candidatus Omnitrophota bacterium]
MSKAFLKICLVLIVGILFVLVPQELFAQGSSVPALQSLSYSLQELKMSAKDLRQKNYWLDSETQNLQNEIEDLKEELNLLQKGQYKPTANEMSLREDGQYKQRQVRRVNENGTSFDETYVKREKVISFKDKKEQELRQAIAATQKEVNWLRNRLGDGDGDGYQAGYDYSKEEQRFIDLIKAHEKKLQQAQKELVHLERKFDKPLEKFEELTAEHERFKRHLAVAQEDSLAVLEDERRIDDELANVNQNIEQEYEKLVQTIAGLKEQENELNKVLVEAQQRLAVKNIDFESYEVEHAQLEENLFVIQNENVNLKERIVSLEKKLEELK